MGTRDEVSSDKPRTVVVRKIKRINALDETNPGPWWTFVTNLRTQVVMVMMRCPFGHLADLEDHKIGDDGMVSPSIVCRGKGCDWHVNVRLADW